MLRLRGFPTHCSTEFDCRGPNQLDNKVNGVNMSKMSRIDIGSRSLIRNSEGKVVGTVIASKTFPGKHTYVRFLPSGDTVVKQDGPMEWQKRLDENVDWSLDPSYFLVKCECVAGIITIQLVHNSMPSWNTIRMVPFQLNWQDAFWADWNKGQIDMGRETHIGNRYDLCV